VFSATVGGATSRVATATVRVTPDPIFDCTDVIGKVFDDVNGNGYQDKGENGLAGVRVVSARGLIATTDKYGRYHLTCAVTPNEDRGSNYILKLDDRSLPSGYRMTTENPLVKRATRGKMLKFNFGAGLHRVVRLDRSDAVFEPNTTDMRPQWTPRIAILLAELKKSPSILRLSYGRRRGPGARAAPPDRVKREITAQWKEASGDFVLAIETETIAPARRRTAESCAMISRQPIRWFPLRPSLAARGALALLAFLASTALAAEPGETEAGASGATVEQHTSPDAPRTPWLSENPDANQGDTVEMRKVLAKDVKTVKLQNVVLPIRFALRRGGDPRDYIGGCAQLERMK
jgi:hypothetical protein